MAGKTLLQRIEQAGQRAIIRGVTAVIRRPARSLDDARRILFLRHDAIGDMIMTTGVFRRIKEARPDLQIDVLASPSNVRVLEGLPSVDRILLHRRGDTWGILWRLRPQFRRRAYDAVLDGRVIWPRVSTDTSFLLAASGAPRTIGIGDRRSDYVYTDRVHPPKSSHMIEQLAALTEPLGIDPRAGNWDPELVLTSAEKDAAERMWGETSGEGPRLLVNVSSGTDNRKWPAENWAATLSRARAAAPDARIYVMAPPSDGAMATAAAVAGRATAGQPTLREAFAMVQQADLVLTPDTSIAHAASAFKKPIVGLYLTWMVENFRAYDTPGRLVTVDAPTLEALEVGPVVDALLEQLSASRSAPRPAE